MHCGPAASNFLGKNRDNYLIGPGAVDVIGFDVQLALRNGWVQVPQPPDGRIPVRRNAVQEALKRAWREGELTTQIEALEVQMKAAQDELAHLLQADVEAKTQ